MYVTFSKDKVMNFKKYLYAFATVLMTVIAPSCVKDGFGEPMISTDNSTYEIPLEGGEVKVMLTSTRSWTARVFPATSLDDIEGIVVEPASGEASSEPIEVTIKATANASYPRAALISFETSVVSAAVTVNQDGPVARPAAELTVAEFLNKEVDASIYYKLTGTIKNLKNTEYGNFDLVDETGSVYVYGLTTEKTGSNDKSFSKLGLKEGDVLTLEGTRAAYNGTPQVGGPAYYISHVAGDAPADPAPVAMTIAEAVAQTDSVLVSGTVMALCAKGFILQDESGIAFISDSGYSQTYVVGDQVKVGGKPGAYNYANQITPNAKYYEKTGSVEVTYPEPVVLNAAKVAEMKDGAGADKNVGVYNPFYITVEGTVRVSGTFFNLDIDGVETSTAQGSFYQLTDAQKAELTALKDKAVVLTGYFQSISQSGGVPKFFNVIYLTVDEKEAEGGEEPTEKAARNLAFSSATATATLGEAFTAPTLSGETDGVVYTSSNTAVATVDAATGAVTLVAAGETTITAAAEETETLQAGSASYVLTVSAAVEPVEPVLADGTYWIVANDLVAKPVTSTYGYLYVEDAWKSTSSVASTQANAFTFTSVEGGYTIQDEAGKYYYGTVHNGSWSKNFNVGTTLPSEGAIWKIVKNDDDTYTITNTTQPSYLQYSVSYNSFGHYTTAQSNAVLPTLVKVENAVPAVTLEASLTFEAEGGSQTITLPEGVTINPSSNNAAFTATSSANVVTVSAAATTEAQSGVLTLVLNYNGFSITKTVDITQKAAPVAGEEVLLDEDFSSLKTWSTSAVTSLTANNLTYTTAGGAMYGQNGCIKFGKSTAAANTGVKLPALSSLTTAKTVTLTFKAVSSDSGYTMNVAASAGATVGTLSPKAITKYAGGAINSGADTATKLAEAFAASTAEFSVTIQNVTAQTVITITASGSAKRWYLDDVKIVAQ